MKKQLINSIYQTISYVRESLGWIIGFIQRCALWSWEFHASKLDLDNKTNIVYIGRKKQRDLAMQLLGINKTDNKVNALAALNSDSVIVSEFSFPNSMCVPIVLSTIVGLDQTKSFESSIEKINKNRSRFYRKNRHSYRLKQVYEDSDIDFVNEKMFRPYAAARHGDSVSHLSRNEIAKMARYTGALNLLYFNDEIVGCHIGKEIVRNGKRYWRSIRAGYPEHVYSESIRFGEINNMNNFLEMEWTFNQGFDFFDLSISLARPLSSVLQWKRSYRGLLSFIGNYSYFHISPPKHQESTFFWHSPLFSKENGALSLHIGIPSTVSNDEAIEYITAMKFGGLANVYLHCQKTPDIKVMDHLMSLYQQFESKPNVKIIEH